VVDDAGNASQNMADPEFLKSQEKASPPVTVTAGENAPLKLVLPAK